MPFEINPPQIGEVRSQRLSDGCMYDFTWDGTNWIPGSPYDCIDLNGGGFGSDTDSDQYNFNPPTFVCQGSPGSTFDGWTLSNVTNVIEQFAPGSTICLSSEPPVVQSVFSGPSWNPSVSPNGIYEAILRTATYTRNPVEPPPPTPPAAGNGYIQTQYDTNASIDLDTIISATRTSAYTLSTPQRGSLTLSGSVVTYDPNVNYSGTDSFTFTYQAVTNGNTFTLTGSVFVNILPPVPPAAAVPTAAISASPSTISLGRSTVLNWNAGSNATIAFIQPGIGNVGINGSLAVTPTATTTYTITAQSNLGVQTTASVVVTVIPAALPPVAVNLGVNCAYQQQAFIPLIYTGEVTSAAITVPPTSGSAIIQGYTVRYTAPAGFVGVDTLTYSVTGPGGIDTAIITVTVQSPACPQPGISLDVNGTQAVNYNTATVINFDLFGTVDKIIITTGPTYGIVSSINIGSSTASVMYTPNSSFLGGHDSFVVVAEGPCGQTLPFTVPILVGTPPAPSPLSAPLSVGHNTPTTFFFTYTGYATGILIVNQPLNGVLTATGIPFQYTYTPTSGYGGSDSIIFRAVGPGGVSNFTGQISITVANEPVILRPDPVTFIDLLNQPSNVTVYGSSATFTGGFLPNYNVSLWCEEDSYTTGTTGQQLTNLYAIGFRRIRSGNIMILGNTGVSVQDGDKFEPIVKTATSVADVPRRLKFRVRSSGNALDPSFVRDTYFYVFTSPADQQPNGFNFVNQTNLEINTLATTNSVLINGMTPGVPTPAKVVGSGSPILLVNNGTTETATSSSTTIYDGYSIRVRATTPSTYSTTANYTVTVGSNSTPVSDTFSLSTRNPYVTAPPWNFGNRGNLELNTAYNTLNTVTFVDLDVASTISVNNNANIILNGVDTQSNSAVITNGSAVAIRGVTANAFNTTRTFTVTLTAGITTKTDTFVLGTRVKDTVPVITGNFANLTYQQLNTLVNSGNININSFDETLNLTLSSNDNTANLIVNGIPSGISAVINSGSNVSITGNSAGDYYSTRLYQITVGGISKSWSVITKSNDDQQLLTMF